MTVRVGLKASGVVALKAEIAALSSPTVTADSIVAAATLEAPASVPQEARKQLGPGAAQVIGWAALANINQVLLLTRALPGGASVRALHHAYDAGQLLAAGLASFALVELASGLAARFGVSERARWPRALAVGLACLGVSLLVVETDVANAAARTGVPVWVAVLAASLTFGVFLGVVPLLALLRARPLKALLFAMGLWNRQRVHPAGRLSGSASDVGMALGAAGSGGGRGRDSAPETQAPAAKRAGQRPFGVVSRGGIVAAVSSRAEAAVRFAELGARAVHCSALPAVRAGAPSGSPPVPGLSLASAAGRAPRAARLGRSRAPRAEDRDPAHDRCASGGRGRRPHILASDWRRIAATPGTTRPDAAGGFCCRRARLLPSRLAATAEARKERQQHCTRPDPMTTMATVLQHPAHCGLR